VLVGFLKGWFIDDYTFIQKSSTASPGSGSNRSRKRSGSTDSTNAVVGLLVQPNDSHDHPSGLSERSKGIFFLSGDDKGALIMGRRTEILRITCMTNNKQAF